MKRTLTLVATIVCTAALLLSTVQAQWLTYPTANVPRTRDGKVDVAAPTPRSADGHPDLSGIWEAVKERPSSQLARQFIDIGFGLSNGLPLQPWAAALTDARERNEGKDDVGWKCLPLTYPRTWNHPFPRKIVQTPGLVVILHEWNTSYRQVFTDGRPLPTDPQPSWNGYSTGRWSGETLVIETTGFRDDLWVDSRGHPLTEAAKVIETIARPNFGTLSIQVTVDDPKAYRAPWTVNLRQSILVDTDLIDAVCAENEKDLAHVLGGKK